MTGRGSRLRARVDLAMVLGTGGDDAVGRPGAIPPYGSLSSTPQRLDPPGTAE